MTSSTNHVCLLFFFVFRVAFSKLNFVGFSFCLVMERRLVLPPNPADWSCPKLIRGPVNTLRPSLSCFFISIYIYMYYELIWHNWLLMDETFNSVFFFWSKFANFLSTCMSRTEATINNSPIFFTHDLECVKIIQLFEKKNVKLMLKISAKYY